MKVAVLGHNGMLGRYVKRYLEHNGFEVETFSRDTFDATRLDLWSLLILRKYDVVVNCIGVIKPQMEKVGAKNSIVVNSLFPHVLEDLCSRLGVTLIHITTDCVYSGAKGMYVETDAHDAMDAYGKSKSLGEPANSTVIRTSIVGEEIGEGRSLLNWVLAQKGKTVKGFGRHMWNGVTCLQLAKVVEKIILIPGLQWQGVRHVFTPQDFSKCEMLELFNKVYDLGMTVERVETQVVSRTLRTNHSLIPFAIPDFETQVREQKEWSATNLK